MDKHGGTVARPRSSGKERDGSKVHGSSSSGGKASNGQKCSEKKTKTKDELVDTTRSSRPVSGTPRPSNHGTKTSCKKVDVEHSKSRSHGHKSRTIHDHSTSSAPKSHESPRKAAKSTSHDVPNSDGKRRLSFSHEPNTSSPNKLTSERGNPANSSKKDELDPIQKILKQFRVHLIMSDFHLQTVLDEYQAKMATLKASNDRLAQLTTRRDDLRTKVDEMKRSVEQIAQQRGQTEQLVVEKRQAISNLKLKLRILAKQMVVVLPDMGDKIDLQLAMDRRLS